MKSQRFMSHGAVAIGALLVGGVCGYNLSPTQAASSIVKRGQAVVVPPVVPAATGTAISPSHVANPVRDAGALPPRTAAPAVFALPMVAGSRVAAVESFRCEVPTGSPVIVVRAMDEEGVWYVQDAGERVEGSTFVCKAVFGNDATPAGTGFQIAAILVTSSGDAQRFVPGGVLNELPADLPVTNAVDVVRQ